MDEQKPTTGRRPGKEDPSRADRAGTYSYKRGFYRSAEVAEDYDFHRFGSRDRRRRNAAKWAAISQALRYTRKVKTVLDIPCGTGRFTGDIANLGYRVVGSDVSYEMIAKGVENTGENKRVAGFVQADAERLPLPARSIDCIVCIRFMLHVNLATRHRILCEMRRVTKRWIVIDYRHKHSFRYKLNEFRKRLGFKTKPLKNRVSREELEQEFRNAGLAVRRVIPVAKFFSDKWVVLAEAPSPAAIK
jgi:ubiquinone/menaquinone biosynthesis C-methylase UbiE